MGYLKHYLVFCFKATIFLISFVYLRLFRNYLMEKLTQQEEEAMLAVWQVGPGFIKEFMDAMPEPKTPYTTLASTVKNLQRKGFLKGERYANAIRYSAKVKEAEYKKRFMTGFVNSYFQSSYKELVAFYAKNNKISAEELKEIIHLIENPEKK